MVGGGSKEKEESVVSGGVWVGPTSLGYVAQAGLELLVSSDPPAT